MTNETKSEASSPEAPKSLWDKAGAALPVALTLLATTFAGMSTSELQQAMFWRSYAAQDQAKATSQWTLAGFKRDRALICETTAAQLRADTGYATLDPSKLNALDSLTVDWLTGQGPLPVELPPITTEAITRLLAEIETRKPESQILFTASQIKHDAVNSCIDQAEEFVKQTDLDWDRPIKAAEKHAANFHKVGDVKNAPIYQAMLYELQNRRYRAESKLNQGVGYLYEARVRVSTAESDRHRKKSQNLFYAMLAAQVGAAVSSLALARRQKSLLWMFAGLAGLISIGIGVYILLGL